MRNTLKLQRLSQKTSIQPIVKAFLTIGIVMSAVFIINMGNYPIHNAKEGAPIIVYILLPVLIAIGFSVLAH